MPIFLIFAYITGGLLVLVSLFNYFFPKRSITLIMKAITDAISIVNLTFVILATHNLSILAGLIATCIGLARDIVFYNRDKHKIFDHLVWPIGFSCFFLASLIFSYKTIFSLLPAVGSVISTMTLFLKDQRHTKIGAIICSSMYCIYYFLLVKGTDVLTIFSFASQFLGFVGASIGLVRILRINSKNKTA